MERIENTILRSLIYQDSYTRRVLPFLKEEYFQDRTDKFLFQKIRNFITDYNNLPSKEALIIELNNTKGYSQEEFDQMVSSLNKFDKKKDDSPNEDWLFKQTETWCQERAIYNAVLDTISILEDKESKKPKSAIPSLLSEALAISFDPHVGHDYIEDADTRYEFYHTKEKKIPFHLEYLNRVTDNGVPGKTLNVCIAGTNVGKSLFLCDLASHYKRIGKNVLYITMEMREERIAERIDANLMDLPIGDVKRISRENFTSKVAAIKAKNHGRLIIKEYPAGANVNHFRALLNELWLKKKFKPDAIFIDYLGICGSSRLKNGTATYEVAKAVAEELRGLGQEYDVPVWTATQTNRQGFASSDVDLTNTAESFGIPATADFMFAMMTDDTLYAQCQFLIKVLKNRYSDIGKNKKFLIGVHRSKMKLYDLEETAQVGLEDVVAEPPIADPDYSNPNQSMPMRQVKSAVFGQKNGQKPRFQLKS